MNRQEGIKQIEETRIIAIVRGVKESDIHSVVGALLRGGITAVEVTMNTPGAATMITSLQQDYGERMFIGAGTVLDLKDAEMALEAGAAFLVTPNTEPEVIHYAAQRDVPVYPGAMTPTEIVSAWKAGATAVKIFPSGSLGLSYIKELQGPLRHIPMIAVGGITEHNIAEYLHVGCYGVGVGGSVVNLKEIANGNYDWIEQQARRLTDRVKVAGANLPLTP